MTETIAVLAVGLVIGGFIGWLISKIQFANQILGERESAQKESAALKLLLAKKEAELTGLEERQLTHTRDLEKLNEKFTLEFELVASRILESKSEKFTQLNKTNIEALLEPLGKNITEFKEQVNKVYQEEGKERFSLGQKVKELAQLNQQLSDDARNLTRALKGEAKTQGRWGEVILEMILEKSGLRKGEEYFMEHQLFDQDGKALRSEAGRSKMRPDAVVKYPDERHVIIDSKVSINAFIRSVECTEPTQLAAELQAHVQAVKNHILDLSAKAYDDYTKTLDFVMMFVPSEAAYVAALKEDPELWNFAYDKRILLTNPTSLIVILKLVVDLWKREYQNRNAQAIAERGAKLYDKFYGFVKNLEQVGSSLDSAREKYQEAYNQLSAGRDNLILQATKLRDLGVKTRNELPPGLVNNAMRLEEDTE